jgi:hypothetical protein
MTTKQVFSMWFPPGSLLGSGPIGTHSDTKPVFSLLRCPCRVHIRESNSEASSCMSTEEYKQYKEYNRVRHFSQLSVADSHGKFVVGGELEISL